MSEKNEEGQTPPAKNGNSPIAMSRRSLLSLGAWTTGTLAVGAVGGIGSQYGDRLLNVVEDYFDISPQRDLGDAFYEFTLSRVMAMSMGNYNLVRAQQGGKQQPSVYIKRAGTGVTNGLCGAFPNYEPSVCSDHQVVEFQNLGDAIYLGGPFSNPKTAEYLGYDLSAADRLMPNIPCPRASNSFRLPFEFLNGETTRGEFDGIIDTAKRYDGGVEVERPVFRVRDRDNGKVYRCEKDGDWLANEYLQIVRVIDKSGHVKIFVWGLHGHSISGFLRPGDTIKNNINQLVARTEGIEQFHALIPIKLERARAIDGSYMSAVADWDVVDSNSLVRDISGVF